ncbi:MAG: DUF4258 domain-containing protein [Pseudolabrys sp.]
MSTVKKLVFIAHAQRRLRERQISLEWVENTVRAPDWSERDPNDGVVERRFRRIIEADGRILRLACVETKAAVRVISVMFDRNAGPKS